MHRKSRGALFTPISSVCSPKLIRTGPMAYARIWARTSMSLTRGSFGFPEETTLRIALFKADENGMSRLGMADSSVCLKRLSLTNILRPLKDRKGRVGNWATSCTLCFRISWMDRRYGAQAGPSHLRWSLTVYQKDWWRFVSERSNGRSRSRCSKRAEILHGDIDTLYGALLARMWHLKPFMIK